MGNYLLDIQYISVLTKKYIGTNRVKWYFDLFKAFFRSIAEADLKFISIKKTFFLHMFSN